LHLGEAESVLKYFPDTFFQRDDLVRVNFLPRWLLTTSLCSPHSPRGPKGETVYCILKAVVLKQCVATCEPDAPVRNLSVKIKLPRHLWFSWQSMLIVIGSL
jgi:hypothetical protein